jgi:hypothetical protein
MRTLLHPCSSLVVAQSMYVCIDMILTLKHEEKLNAPQSRLEQGTLAQDISSIFTFRTMLTGSMVHCAFRTTVLHLSANLLRAGEMQSHRATPDGAVGLSVCRCVRGVCAHHKIGALPAYLPPQTLSTHTQCNVANSMYLHTAIQHVMTCTGDHSALERGACHIEDRQARDTVLAKMHHAAAIVASAKSG